MPKKSSQFSIINTERRLLSSGSILFNLACSGDPRYAMTSGRYFWMVGDSSSGKTFFSLMCMAEAAINEEFDEYDLIFDNAEDGALMNVTQFFGKKLAARLQPPRKDDVGDPVYSTTVDEFYTHLDDRFKAVRAGKARKFIYLLDSMDALDSSYALKKFNEKKIEVKGGKKAKGDFGDGKAKWNSQNMRRVSSNCRDTDSILIIISQTRDNIDAGLFDPKSTASGGRSLKFYAGWQMWASIAKRLYKKINDTDRQIGIVAKMAIKKNRLSGKEWTIYLPIFWSYGIDDIGACVDFLIDEKKLVPDKNGIIESAVFDFNGKRAALISKIEEERLYDVLQNVVVRVWKDIEDRCAVKRRNKYQEE